MADKDIAKLRKENLSRKEFNRQLKMEHVRDSMNIGRYLSAIHDCEHIAAITIQEAKANKDKLNHKQISARKLILEAIRTRAEINFKLLQKLLPDLKSIELKTEAGKQTVDLDGARSRLYKLVSGEVLESKPNKKDLIENQEAVNEDGQDHPGEAGSGDNQESAQPELNEDQQSIPADG